ncbi:hypothetical protein AOLI_G00117340 [Acnodon oligacanthus]
MKQLEAEILELQRLRDSAGDQSHTADLKSKKGALGNLLGFRTQGALVRPRYRSLTQLDAPSTFFFNLERKNGQSRFIHSLCSEEGQEPTEPVDIRKRALMAFRRAVIILLPKKGGLQDIKNWRPVSLCTDLKVFSKALAIRLRDVMGHVIHLDQTYCVPGRTISDNICLIRDVLEVSNILGVDSGLISLDQEKAVARVEHQYLWCTLEAFGFSPYFITMVRVSYQDVESVLKISGGLSAPFRAERGIRQGCALSGMLYSLAIEPLLNRLHSKFEGFAFTSA